MSDHFVIHILTTSLTLDDEEKRTLNPIDTKIIALGIRYRGENFVTLGKPEQDMLREFWEEWAWIHQTKPPAEVVGFNIVNFDLPFLTSRSFLHNVPIVPFLLKNVVDLREKINAYRYGPTRGKLIEYAGGGESTNRETCTDEELRIALAQDIEMIDMLYERAKRTNILEVKRW